jgi:hydrogenase expression/formation protein HypE
VLVSGTLGDHGLAVLSAREGLELGSGLESDTAPLHRLTTDLLDMGATVRFLRDPTRGGVAAVLHELCDTAGLSVVLEESALPVSPAVRGACELLGLDPLFVANEGKLVAVVSPETVGAAVETMRRHPEGRTACRIGEVGEAREAPVLVRGPLGALRVLDEPSGAPLPRICLLAADNSGANPIRHARVRRCAFSA